MTEEFLAKHSPVVVDFILLVFWKAYTFTVKDQYESVTVFYYTHNLTHVCKNLVVLATFGITKSRVVDQNQIVLLLTQPMSKKSWSNLCVTWHTTFCFAQGLFSSDWVDEWRFSNPSWAKKSDTFVSSSRKINIKFFS